MKMGCADCGCIVESGVMVVPCGKPDCCCQHLPVRFMTTCACCDLEKLATVALNCHPDTSLCSDCLDWLVRRRDKQTAVAGPTRIVNEEPIFLVADVARARTHYERLGFTTDEHNETYAFAHRDDLTIHLASADARPTVGQLYLHVTDAYELADAWRKAGVEVVGPEKFDYGKREGSHTDPDGNLIRFGSPLRSN